MVSLQLSLAPVLSIRLDVCSSMDHAVHWSFHPGTLFAVFVTQKTNELLHKTTKIPSDFGCSDLRMDDLISTFRRGLAAQNTNEVSAVLSHHHVTLNKLLCWPCWICESLCWQHAKLPRCVKNPTELMRLCSLWCVWSNVRKHLRSTEANPGSKAAPSCQHTWWQPVAQSLKV